MNCPGSTEQAILGASIHMRWMPGMTSTLEATEHKVCFFAFSILL